MERCISCLNNSMENKITMEAFVEVRWPISVAPQQGADGCSAGDQGDKVFSGS